MANLIINSVFFIILLILIFLFIFMVSLVYLVIYLYRLYKRTSLYDIINDVIWAVTDVMRGTKRVYDESGLPLDKNIPGFLLTSFNLLRDSALDILNAPPIDSDKRSGLLTSSLTNLANSIVAVTTSNRIDSSGKEDSKLGIIADTSNAMNDAFINILNNDNNTIYAVTKVIKSQMPSIDDIINNIFDQLKITFDSDKIASGINTIINDIVQIIIKNIPGADSIMNNIEQHVPSIIDSSYKKLLSITQSPSSGLIDAIVSKSIFSANTSLTDTLSSSSPNAITTIFNNFPSTDTIITNVLDSLNKNSNIAQEFINNIINGVINEIKENIKGLSFIETFFENVNNITQNFKEIDSYISTIGNNFKDAVKTSEQFVTLLDSLSKTLSSFITTTGSIDSISTLMDNIFKLVTVIENGLSIFVENVINSKDVKSVLLGIFNALTSANNALSTIGDLTLVKDFKPILDTLKEKFEGISLILDNMPSSSDTLNIKNIIEDIGSKLATINTGFNLIDANINGDSGILTNTTNIAAVTTTLNTNINNIKNIFEGTADKVGLNTIINDLRNTIDNISKIVG